MGFEASASSDGARLPANQHLYKIHEMRNTIIYAVGLTVLLSIGMAVMNQIRKGEPRLDHAVLFGLLTGVSVAAIHHWQNKKKTKSDDDPQ